MTDIQRKYIVDENNKKIAVQLNINTFEKIEEILENFALVQLIKETEKGGSFQCMKRRISTNLWIRISTD